ncbi:MAG: cob(I)yrinic acid a,c-diamide adenosyltransferase [Lachnospiraceae bacterium]|nr:cob(I)yrinic acid a,c-diamide adenosyltransferase [Lachnospiraceae bacterium]
MIHVYKGKGKGKTSAAIGLAIRAAGAGKKVVFAQFMKGNESSELNVLEKVENIRVMRLSRTYPFTWEMTLEDRSDIVQEHDALLAEIQKIFAAGEADVFVLDEITYPVTLGLLSEDNWKQILASTKANPEAEWVFTGQDPTPQMLEMADYITDMQSIRHPYDRGVEARKGIEF